MTLKQFSEHHPFRRRRKRSEENSILQHQAVTPLQESSTPQTVDAESAVLQASGLQASSFKHDFSDVPVLGPEQSFSPLPLHPFLRTSYPRTTEQNLQNVEHFPGQDVAQLAKAEDSDIHTDFGKSCTLQALALVTPYDQKAIAGLFAKESLDYTEDADIRKMLPKLGFTRLVHCDGDYAEHHMQKAGGGKFVMIMTASGGEGHMLAAKCDAKKGAKIVDYQRHDDDAKLYKSDRVEIWKYK